MDSLLNISKSIFPLWKDILKEYTTPVSLPSFTHLKNDNSDHISTILLEDMKSLTLSEFTAGREMYETNSRNHFSIIPEYHTWKSKELEFTNCQKNFTVDISEHFGILTNESENFKNFRFGNFLINNEGYYVQNGFGVGFFNNITFVGNWCNNLPIGFFLIAGPEQVYYGMIENGDFNGIAKVFADNIVYHGEIKNGVFEGKGITFNNYGCYVGKFRANKKKGFGTLESFCNKSYTGMWENNLFHGKGTLVVKNSTTYVGRFDMGKRNGYGVCTFHNGNIYKGKWKDDHRHGHGIYISHEGQKRYDGEWKQSQKHGYGVEIYSHSEKYAGTFKCNVRHGRGFLNFSNGCSYHGCFKHGIPYGNGVMYRSNNMVWKEGSFRGNVLHGLGKLYHINGRIEKEGKFIDGNFIDVNNIMIRKFIETRDYVFLKKISKTVLQDFIKQNYNISPDEISTDNSKHSLITKLISVHNEKQQNNEKNHEKKHDIFGNEIIHPCLGNDGETYDYKSMSYLFKRKNDGSFENITYVYDENNQCVPKFPIMGNGKVLSDYTPVLSPSFVTPPRTKQISTETQNVSPEETISSISDFVPLHRSLQSEFYSEIISFDTENDYS